MTFPKSYLPHLNYVKNYFFSSLKEEFKKEIAVHTARVGLHEYWSKRLADIADCYLDGLSKNRENVLGAVKIIGDVHAKVDCHQFVWNPDDFILTPLRLEERIGSKFISERDREHENLRSAEYRLDNIALSDIERRKLLRERKRLKMRTYFLDQASFSIFDNPSEIIASAYEISIVRTQGSLLYTTHDCVEFNDKEYLASYNFLDKVAKSEKTDYGKGQQRRIYERRIDSFVRHIKKHAGDIEAIAKVIKRHLGFDDRNNLNTREFYIDPFYPKNMKTLKFPSAQADFVAARLIACAEYPR